MVIKKEIIVYTRSLEEEAKVMKKFPNASWVAGGGFPRRWGCFLPDKLSIEEVRGMLNERRIPKKN